MSHHPTLCFFGFSESEEGGRAWMMRTGLVENEVTIVPCRTSVAGFVAKYRDLYRTWKGIGRVDAIYVIFMGYYLMPLAWYLARRRGIPVILDAFVSQYDTEVSDRKRLSRFSPRAWFLWMVDYLGCFFADAIVVDTEAHKRFFVREFFVREDKIIVVPIGCRYDVFQPLSEKETEGDFVIEFHGSFIPLQGIEYILAAAKVLQDKGEAVRFEIIGDGQTYSAMKQIARDSALTNVAFLGKRPQKEIPAYIARAHICLGIFGTTDKALRVIPHKVYECLSCGKPVITERSPAVLEVLRDGDAVCLVEPGDGADLAEKIIALKHDTALRTHLGERARAVSLNEFSTRVIVKPLVAWLTTHV